MSSASVDPRLSLRFVLGFFALAWAHVMPGQEPFGFGHDRGELPPERVLIFFPPMPPPLDASMPNVSPAAIQPSAPGELAEYIGEVFYPPLSCRLHSKSLTSKQRQQLASYRAIKTALQQEIRGTLATTRDAEPAARAAALQSLARRQTAQLDALEQAAEELRGDLIASNRRWGAYREWRLNDHERRAFSPVEIAQVMRAFAFYEKGLLPAQRGFLREIAHELMLAAETTPAALAAEPHVFFSPSPARVAWPENNPPEVKAKLAAYTTKKAALKKELYDTVYQSDNSMRPFAQPGAELGAKQAARIAELEKLAEEIRVALAAVPPARIAKPTSPLSPKLAEEAAALAHRRTAMKKDATLRMEAVADHARKQQIKITISFRFEADGLKFVIVPLGNPHARFSGEGPSPDLQQEIKMVGAEISGIADDYGRELVAVANAEEELRVEVAAVLNTKKPQTIDDTLQAAIQVVDAEHNANAYNEYRAAVFEPGLSPAQRRILFDGAIEQLDLPLPRGEMQPWRRRDSW